MGPPRIRNICGARAVGPCAHQADRLGRHYFAVGGAPTGARIGRPGATPSTNTDNLDIANYTGLATAITSMSTNLTGTPSDGDLLEFRFTDNGTARAITWGASFSNSTVSVPTTTVASTMLRVGFEYNSTASSWVCIAVA